MAEPFDRRGLLAGALGLAGAAVLGGCSQAVDPRGLRLGFFPNVTHAPALLGMASGDFARSLGGVRLTGHAFNAGPEALGALLAGALDLLYVGPVPAVTGYLRTRGRGLRIVSGTASGGSALVARPGLVRGAQDLRGRRVATPQLGNSQDLALRGWLLRHGLRSLEYGGDVRVTPLRNSLILQQFRRGFLDAAWVPEPWATRLVEEAGAVRVFDESTLWPGGRFAATVLVARGAYLAAGADNVGRLLTAHEGAIRAAQAGGPAVQDAVREAMARYGARVSGRLLGAAWGRVEFTADPLQATIAEMARVGSRLALVPPGDVAGLVACPRAGGAGIGA